MRYSRFFAAVILAFSTVLFFSIPASTANKPGKKGHAPKRKAPKPKHQAKHHVKAKPHGKGHKSAHGKKSGLHAHKKAHPKPKHHAQAHVKPKSHSQNHAQKGAKKVKRDAKQVQTSRTHSRITNRAHEWSRYSSHESHWSHHHWHTHHFAHFDGVGVGGDGGGYGFDPGWWNSYVVNPGIANWSDPPIGIAASTLPTPAPAGVKPPPVVKVGQAMPISEQGEALARLLDSVEVESHWLPFQAVDWRTGIASDESVKGPASNGGAFIAAVCKRFKISLPTDEAEDFLPKTQIDWFLNISKEKGWIKVGEVESQVLANQGWVVVAAWQNMAPAGHRENSGQLAIVRPDREPVVELAARGPLVIMAGPQNHSSIGLKDGFPAGAWSKQEVVYLAHRTQ